MFTIASNDNLHFPKEMFIIKISTVYIFQRNNISFPFKKAKIH